MAENETIATDAQAVSEQIADDPEIHVAELPVADIQVRDIAKRELDIRMLPWNTVIDTMNGLEEFRRGAFADTKPSDVLLMGLQHEAHIGLGQDGQPVLTRHPVGKAIALDDRADAQYGTFRVAKTARGDEVLALASEGIVTGASVEWAALPGGTTTENHNGRRKSVHSRARLTGLSTTYRPAYKDAGVVAVRSHQEGIAAMADDQAAVAATDEKPAAPAYDFSGLEQAVTAMNSGNTTLLDRMEKLEERSRSQFVVPGAPETPKTEITGGLWFDYALKALSGDRISTSDSQYRDLADVITTDNLGVVPDTFSSELIGVIDPSRPFMSSTRRLPTPSSGMTLHVPVLSQRPTVGLQSEEKTQISSQATSITTADFAAVTKAGGGDLSLQILKRSDRSFLDLYLQLLAEAYAIDSETEALEALLAADVDDGHVFDPDDTHLGDAFITSFDAIRRGPDTIWLSSAAVGALIDAVSPVTGSPVYSSITADFTVPGGISGSIKGLRPVHVPQLAGLGADVIVGPSSGFAWAEDGTYTLQVDNPAKAGRDVALVGILWFAPWYPSAFTVYTLES